MNPPVGRASTHSGRLVLSELLTLPRDSGSFCEEVSELSGIIQLVLALLWFRRKHRLDLSEYLLSHYEKGV